MSVTAKYRTLKLQCHYQKHFKEINNHKRNILLNRFEALCNFMWWEKSLYKMVITCMLPINSAKRMSPSIASAIEKRDSPGNVLVWSPCPRVLHEQKRTKETKKRLSLIQVYHKSIVNQFIQHSKYQATYLLIKKVKYFARIYAVDYVMLAAGLSSKNNALQQCTKGSSIVITL